MQDGWASQNVGNESLTTHKQAVHVPGNTEQITVKHLCLFDSVTVQIQNKANVCTVFFLPFSASVADTTPQTQPGNCQRGLKFSCVYKTQTNSFIPK